MGPNSAAILLAWPAGPLLSMAAGEGLAAAAASFKKSIHSQAIGSPPLAGHGTTGTCQVGRTRGLRRQPAGLA